MNKKSIIVAGAGHGGIAAAAHLAKQGFDVTILEKKPKGKLGYDWTDIFAPGSLTGTGIPMPDESKYEYKENMTFLSPSLRKPITQNVPQNELEIKMERSDIYEHLINYAEKCGAKVEYEVTVKAPITIGNRVVGVETDKGERLSPLVIDACGLNSPLRTGMPNGILMEKNIGRNNRFYVYRAFYSRLGDSIPEHNYKVYMLQQGKAGIGWLATEKDFCDVLIGRFLPLSDEKVESALEHLKQDNPQLGDKLLRGGQYVEIPVRHPLSTMVCDGYVAIGDSAYMTVPIIGSGIANCLKAAKILSDVIAKDKQLSFSAETLWEYQRRYYKELGNSYAVLACVKDMLSELTPAELDYMFDNNILTAKELTIGADSTKLTSMINMSVKEAIAKLKALGSNKPLIKKLLKVASKMAKVILSTSAMPLFYTRSGVAKWANSYLKCFKRQDS